MQHEKHFPKNKIMHKMWWETSLKKKTEFSISWDHQPEVLYSLLLLYLQFEGSRIISKLRCRSLAFTSNNAFLKNKKRSGTNIPASFLARLLKKDQISPYFTLLLEILDRISNVTVCFPDCDVISFKINLSFLINPHDQKSQDKNLTIWRTNTAFKMK